MWSSSGPLQLLHHLAATPQFTPIWDLLLWVMGLLPLLFAFAVGPLAAGGALAQQPVQPLPRLGGCPLGYYASGNYCVPSKGGNTRGAIEKTGNSCPLGFYASGNYCLSSPGSKREAIEKVGSSCPLGWFSSGNTCVKSR